MYNHNVKAGPYMNAITSRLRKLSTPRLLSLGFFSVILAGALLLALPISWNPDRSVSFIDSLFVSTSCVCVTGLTTVPCGETFNLFGRIVMAVLIQIGGLGVAGLGVMLTLIMGKKVGMKSRELLLTSLNFSGYAGLIRFMKIFLLYVLCFESLGAITSFFVFIHDYPFIQAAGYALFHAISAFNNAGFDVFGGYDSMLYYANNVPINLITMALVIIGGFGFFAIWDLWHNRFCWKKLTLNTKIVSIMTCVLLIGGTIILKMTTAQTWLEAAFQSTIARTAGFNTFPLAQFSPAAILVFVVLMFIGANPGGTGGGIKTTTFFAVMMKACSSTMNADRDEIFYRKIPGIVFSQALTVFFFGLTVITAGTILILAMQPSMDLASVLVEVTSAFATVGSTVGITPQLCAGSKIVLMICMFIGRLGPITIAGMLVFKGHNESRFTEESIMIG